MDGQRELLDDIIADDRCSLSCISGCLASALCGETGRVLIGMPWTDCTKKDTFQIPKSAAKSVVVNHGAKLAESLFKQHFGIVDTGH